jgi:adenylate kinase family enzyme
MTYPAVTEETGAVRIVVIGNSGGGKSTLARRLADRHDLPYVEIDALLWQPDWELAPEATYAAAHARAITAERWVIDGLGRRDSIPARLVRATEIILVDMPLWMHGWLAAERQIAWATGRLEHPPAGNAQMPPTEAVFRNLWEVDQEWMPEIRELVGQQEAGGKRVHRICSVEELERFARDSS